MKEYRSYPVRPGSRTSSTQPPSHPPINGLRGGGPPLAEMQPNEEKNVSKGSGGVDASLCGSQQPTPRRGSSPSRPFSALSNGRARDIPIINLENFESFPKLSVKTVFNSPRSLAVCAEHGIHATELLPRAPQDFLAPAVPETIAAMRFHHYEARRQEKLALLRSARADRIARKDVEASTVVSGDMDASGVPCATIRAATTTAPRSGRCTTPRVLTAASKSARPSLAAASHTSGRFASASTTASQNAAHHQDATALLERAARRELVYERAMKNRLEREQQVIQRQILAEQRAVAHRHACEEEKVKVIELRRLKWSDARENIEHKRRQLEYHQRRRQDMSADARLSREPLSRWDVLAAKEQYFTPRQRDEKFRRSSSATR